MGGAQSFLERALIGAGIQAITRGMVPQNAPRKGTARAIRRVPQAGGAPALPATPPAISPQMRARWRCSAT